jgi:hypothetical protein
MARNIALTITLNGVEQSVSSINELEAALRTAREELSGLEIGSDSFKKLSREISEADTKLKQLNNTAKGSQINKTLDNTLKAGRLIASSFGAATAALGLFGVKSETLAQAQVRALQALTLTTTLADLATQKKTFTDLAATIQQRALTLSTTASTAAMRTFFAVIAANPMGALLTVIGLVIGLVIARGAAGRSSHVSHVALLRCCSCRVPLTHSIWCKAVCKRQAIPPCKQYRPLCNTALNPLGPWDDRLGCA